MAQYLDELTMKKYNIFLKDYMISRDPLNRWCPNVQCSQIVKLPDLNTKSLQCPFCNTQMCGLCGLEFHGKIKCDQVAEEQIR